MGEQAKTKRLVLNRKNLLQEQAVRLLTSPLLAEEMIAIRASGLGVGAGRGVFARKPIQQGSAICFYAGEYFPPPPPLAVAVVGAEEGVVSSLAFRKLLSSTPVDSSYQAFCTGVGGYIDAINEKHSSNSMACAHLVNHTSTPNSVFVHFHFSELNPQTQRDDELLTRKANDIVKMASGTWYVEPLTLEAVPLTPSSAPLAGIILVASKDIQPGEEIFVDYALEKKNGTPSWYVEAQDKLEVVFEQNFESQA